MRGPADISITDPPGFIDLVLPDPEDVVAGAPSNLASVEECRARVQLAYAMAHARATADDLEAVITVLQARAGGTDAVDPFGPRVPAESFEALAERADRAHADGRLDLPTALSLLSASGSIAAQQGRRLILFLGLNSYIRRAVWEHATLRVKELDLGSDRYLELGRWLLVTSELVTLAIGEGYRATERELLARDAAAQRAALDELLEVEPATARAVMRARRLAMRFGLDPDATYRVVAIRAGLDADPTPEEPSLDEADLETLAARLDQRVRRRERRAEVGNGGIRLPLVLAWRGSIVAILSSNATEWTRLQDALRAVLGKPGAAAAPTWTAIATGAAGIEQLPRSVAELQEGLRVAEDVGTVGVVADLGELALERLLLSDPVLAGTVIDRELGPLLADPRMGEELVQTLRTFFDSGFNRRETARRLHLADRTVAYRLERIEELLGHDLRGEAGRRVGVALTLHRLR